MAREIWVQSQVESYQRLKKWYLMPPCLTLSIIRYGSRVKWSNPGKGVAPSPTPRCSKLSKREPSGHPRLWSPTYRHIYTDGSENNNRVECTDKFNDMTIQKCHLDKDFIFFAEALVMQFTLDIITKYTLFSQALCLSSPH